MYNVNISEPFVLHLLQGTSYIVEGLVDSSHHSKDRESKIGTPGAVRVQVRESLWTLVRCVPGMEEVFNKGERGMY